MVQSRTARCAFQSPYLTDPIEILAEITAFGDEPGPIPTGNHRHHRGWRQPSGRIDFAPPMCALPHSTPDAGRPMSRFSGADAVPTPRKEKLCESLKVRLQSSRVDRAAWRWRAPSGSLKKAPTFL